MWFCVWILALLSHSSGLNVNYKRGRLNTVNRILGDGMSLFMTAMETELGTRVENKSNGEISGNVCCTDAQWETSALLTSGDVNYDANTFFAYFNGTGKIAFDRQRKKSYLRFNVTEYTPLFPEPGHEMLTAIKDYEKGVMYQIYTDGTCETQPVPKNMGFVCVPGNAQRLGSGTLGPSNVTVTSYRYTVHMDNIAVTTTATVTETGPDVCEPVAVTYFTQGAPGTLYNLDVIDWKPDVTDPSIFIPPPSCGGN